MGIILLTVLALALLARHAGAGSVIPANRLYDWQNYSGVPGGIMVNATQTVSSGWTVYTNLATNVTTTAMNAAIANCPNGQVVQLTNGTYTVTAKTLIARSRVVLRGTGMYVSETEGTRLASSASFPDDMIVHIKNGYQLDNINYATGEFSLTNVIKDSLSITTMQAHGLSVADRVLLDKRTNLFNLPKTISTENYLGRQDGQRPSGQFVQVASIINSTAFTITAPIAEDFANIDTPKGVKIASWVTNVGVESLTIDTLTTTGSQGKSTVQIEGASDYWFYNVKLLGNYYRAAWIYGSFRGVWQHCWVKGNRPIGADYDASYTSDRAYGLYFGPHNTSVQVLDSIFENLTLGVTFEGTAPGCVVAYSYFTDIWWMSTGAGESKINFGVLMHGPCPAYVLIEGNYVRGRWRADRLFGNSKYFTMFRNWFEPQDRRTETRTIYFQWFANEVEADNYGYNFVGNRFGSGLETTYMENCTTFNDYGTSVPTAKRVIHKLGHAYNTTSATGSDTNVYDSMILWGNYDTVNAGIMNHAPTYSGYNGDTNSPTIPSSYLYAEKPAWMGGHAFPGVDVATSPNAAASTNVTAAAWYNGIDRFALEGGGSGGQPGVDNQPRTPRLKGMRLRP